MFTRKQRESQVVYCFVSLRKLLVFPRSYSYPGFGVHGASPGGIILQSWLSDPRGISVEALP